MKIDLQNAFEAKKVENEFQNREPMYDNGEIMAPYQPLLDEMKLIKQKLKTYAAQVHLLSLRLYSLRKNYYDDMTIIDSETVSGNVSPPWKSIEPYTSNQYSYWSVAPSYINMDGYDPIINEVAIRKAGNEKQIKVLDNICRRMQNLDDMAKTFYFRKKDIKSELNREYGGTLASNLE